jgi:tryptophan synthase alpha chain
MNKNKNSIIEKVFEELRKSGRKAFIPFITCGFPSINGFLKLFEILERNGADIIEIGIPFSDPLADGPVIQKTSKIALENGVNTDVVFKTIAKIRRNSGTPIAIMTYFNTIYRYGLEKFLKNAESAGVNGLIIPDLPLEELICYENHFNRTNIDNIMLASLTSSKDRLKNITEKSRGFIYCISVKGVTGIRSGISPEVIDFLIKLRAVTALPLALGFGLSSKEQISRIKDYCDGIIIGSKILSLILEADNFKKGIGEVEDFTRGLNDILKL